MSFAKRSPRNISLSPLYEGSRDPVLAHTRSGGVLVLRRCAVSLQAIFFRRRHQPRRPPLAKYSCRSALRTKRFFRTSVPTAMLAFADDAALARLVIAAAQRRARLPQSPSANSLRTPDRGLVGCCIAVRRRAKTGRARARVGKSAVPRTDKGPPGRAGHHVD